MASFCSCSGTKDVFYTESCKVAIGQALSSLKDQLMYKSLENWKGSSPELDIEISMFFSIFPIHNPNII